MHLFVALQILWLSDNPLSHKPGYEENVSRILPQVTKLDNVGELIEVLEER